MINLFSIIKMIVLALLFSIMSVLSTGEGELMDEKSSQDLVAEIEQNAGNEKIDDSKSDKIISGEKAGEVIKETAKDNTKETSSEDTIVIEGETYNTEELLNEISPEDQMKLFKYVTSLDLTYVIDLANEGMTDENQELLRAHMKERLSEEDYEDAKELIIKYIHLIR